MADEGYNNLYNVTLMVILEYMADTNCYRARPVIEANSRVSYYVLHSIDSIGAAGLNNSEGAPQVARIYRPNTQVLACVPANIPSNPSTAYIGYIIGEVSSVRAAKKALDNLSTTLNEQPVYTFRGNDVIRDMNIANNTVATNRKNILEENQLSYRGNTRPDNLSDDYVIEGKNTRLLLDDYILNINASTIDVTYSAISGTIAEKSLLRSERTIASSSNMYIIGDSSLFENKYSFNVSRSYFDCYTKSGDQLIPDKSVTPSYDYTEHIGEIVDGKISTLYRTTKNNDKRMVAFQERLKSDGSLELNSSSRISLRHTTRYYDVSCRPPAIMVSDDLNKAGEYVNIKEVKAKNPEYGTDDTEGKLLPPLKRQQLEDVVDSSKWPAIGESALDLNDDGSIKLTDAWGSYILLSRGNIQIHAANDIFVTARRNSSIFSGDTTTVSSTNVTDISSDQLSRVTARTAMELSSPELFQKVKTLTQNATMINTKSNYLTVNSRYVNIGRSNAEIAVGGRTITTKASRNNIMATAHGCLNITGGGSCYICANLKVGGNIDTGSLSQTITIAGKEYNYASRGSGRITVHGSSLYVAKKVIAMSTVLSGKICARTVAHEKGPYVYDGDPNLSAYDQLISAPLTSQTYDILGNEEVLTAMDDKTLSIDVTWANSGLYLLQPGESTDGERQNSKVYNGSTGDKKFKGTGEKFWNSDGIAQVKDNEPHNLSLRKGFKSYRYESSDTEIVIKKNGEQ